MRTFLRYSRIWIEFWRQLLRFSVGALWYRVRYIGNREARRTRTEKLLGLTFTDFFRNLSATFIKIGQILSSRPDVLPPYIIDELKSLQDQVPPFAFEHVERTMREEFGKSVDEIFAEFTRTPIAAASIAQVHEARLVTGERVAVKVQRPNIAETMHRDLAIVRTVTRISDTLPYLKSFRLSPLAANFGEAISNQLDLTKERANNERFQANLGHIEFVKFPGLHTELCSGRVLTMEFVSGKRLHEVVAAPPIAPKLLADHLFDIYVTMVFGNQFVHADLHPGNVFIDDTGRFILMDTGLVVDMPRRYVKRFLRLAMAAATLDGRVIIRTYLEDREGPPLDPETLAKAERDAEILSQEVKGKPLEEVEIGLVILKLFALLRRYKLWMEPELTMMFVSDVTMEGMAKTLDPAFDISTEMQRKIIPWVRKMDWLDPRDLILTYYRDNLGVPLGPVGK